MENFSKEKAIALYDHKRFPTIWQAMAGCASMQFTVIAPILVLNILFGSNYQRFFNSYFGFSMFNGIITQIFAILIIPILLILICKKDMKATLRIKKRIDFTQAGLLIVICLGLFFAMQLINALFISYLSSFMGEPANISDTNGTMTIPQLLFEIVIVAGMPAVCEEIFFRGFVLRAFERYSPIAALLLSSLTFSIMHGNLMQVVYAFLLGIVLGGAVMLTDSLLSSIIMHFTLNATSVIISYPGVYGEYMRFADNNPDLYLFLATFVLPAIAITAIVFFVMHTRKKNTRLYGKAYVSELQYPHLMPKQKGWQIAATLSSWGIFCLINLYTMIELWNMYA